MATTSGHNAVIQVSTNDSSYSTVGKMSSSGYKPGKKDLDTSSFGEAAGSQIKGLYEFSGQASGFYDSADAGQTAVLAAALNGGTFYVKYLPDGTNGYKFLAEIPPVDISSDQSGAVKFSWSWICVGTPTAVP